MHGFPNIIWMETSSPLFQERGYGPTVPDLPDYGGTNGPNDTEANKSKNMAHNLTVFLDGYQIQEIIGVGHDWYTA